MPTRLMVVAALLATTLSAAEAQDDAPAGLFVVDLRRAPAGSTPTTKVAVAFSWAEASRRALDCGNLPPQAPQVGHLASLVGCAARPQAPLADRLTAARAVADVIQRHGDQGRLRMVSRRGSLVRLVVLQTAELVWSDRPLVVRGVRPQITVTEEARRSRLETDLVALAQLARAVAAAPADAAECPLPGVEAAETRGDVWITAMDHRLVEKRATLSTEASLPALAPTVLASPPGCTPERVQHFLRMLDAHRQRKACSSGTRRDPMSVLACVLMDEQQPAPARATAAKALGKLGHGSAAPLLVDALHSLGPPGAESLELRTAILEALGTVDTSSAGAGSGPTGLTPVKASLLTGPKEHWFFSADVPLTKASQLQTNEQTGQVELADEPSTFYVGVNFMWGDLAAADQGFFSNVVFKGLLKASRRPLDSLGFGMSMRGLHLKSFGLDFDTLSPFCAITFTKQDRATAGSGAEGGGRNHEVRFGVALNLDKALAWVKGGSQ